MNFNSDEGIKQFNQSDYSNKVKLQSVGGSLSHTDCQPLTGCTLRHDQKPASTRPLNESLGLRYSGSSSHRKHLGLRYSGSSSHRKHLLLTFCPSPRLPFLDSPQMLEVGGL